MRFLADESCDFAVVYALRKAKHDVLAVVEITPRAADSDVIRLARKQKRILLTEDKDFGQLVYASGQKALGVVFLRFPASARDIIANDMVMLVEEQKEKLFGSFVVVQPGKIRISRMPGGLVDGTLV
jgi:predicted nuclease of predicted toxin-antitoxin system